LPTVVGVRTRTRESCDTMSGVPQEVEVVMLPQP